MPSKRPDMLSGLNSRLMAKPVMRLCTTSVPVTLQAQKPDNHYSAITFIFRSQSSDKIKVIFA